MSPIELLKYEIKRIKVQYKCKHLYQRTKVICDEMTGVLGYKSVWHCIKCDKRKVSSKIDKC